MPPEVADKGASGSASSGASSGSSSTGSSSSSGSSDGGSATASLERASASLGGDSSSQPNGGAGGASAGATSTGAATSLSVTPGASTTVDAPENRIQQAVKNARAELEQQLGWARRYGSQQEVDEAVNLVNELRRDPKAFMQRLTAEMAGDEDEPDPVPDLESTDGRKQAFSVDAVKKLMSNLEKRLSRQFGKQLEPLQAYTNEGRSREQMAQIVTDARTTAKEALTVARELPHFKENEKAISEKLAAIDPAVRRRVGSVAAMYMAYNAVLTEKVFPTLKSQTEKEVIDGFNKSANASAGAVAPGGGTSGKPTIREGNLDDLASHMARLSGA